MLTSFDGLYPAIAPKPSPSGAAGSLVHQLASYRIPLPAAVTTVTLPCDFAEPFVKRRLERMGLDPAASRFWNFLCSLGRVGYEG